MSILKFEELHPKINWSGIVGICPRCGDVIVSIYNKRPKFEHDYVSCGCKTSMVDNGEEYARMGGNIIYLGIVNKNSKYVLTWNNEDIELEDYYALVNRVKFIFITKKDNENFTTIKVKVVNE